MNKKTQMWIGILAIAGGAYWLMTQKKKDRVFANLKGPGNIGGGFGQGPLGPNRPAEPCSSGSCVDGRCIINSYGPYGNIIGQEYHSCSGSGDNIRVGGLITAF
mgnify:CR=1 FL=1